MSTGGRKYSNRATFYLNSTARTTATDGQRPETATEVCKRWVEVMPLSGRERMASDQQQSDVTYRLRVRSDETTRTLTRKHWLTLMAGTRLNIKSILDMTQERRELELECTERA